MTFNDLTPLRRVEEMRADFIANASHELRTPLAALLHFIETLQGPRRTTRSRAKYSSASSGRRRAWLASSTICCPLRVELNAHLQPGTPVDLAPFVRQVVDGLQTLARDRRIEIEVTSPPDAVIVLGAATSRSAHSKIWSKITEYGAAGDNQRHTSAGATGGGTPEARVAVRDYRPGIAPEHLPRLTERFYRVDVSDGLARAGLDSGLRWSNTCSTGAAAGLP